MTNGMGMSKDAGQDSDDPKIEALTDQLVRLAMRIGMGGGRQCQDIGPVREPWPRRSVGCERLRAGVRKPCFGTTFLFWLSRRPRDARHHFTP